MGLIIAVIFAAAMSAIPAEVNSLATVSVIDIYKRHLYRGGTDGHYLLASRVATVFWGLYAVMFAQFGKNLGSLIEAVNRLGSLLVRCWVCLRWRSSSRASAGPARS